MKRPGRKLLSLLLALALTLALAAPALADESTTTRGSTSKEQDARTEMYVVTQTPGSDYPTFGAKNEPSGGVYFGRYVSGGKRADGSWGQTNINEMRDESIVAYYWELHDTYGLEYWSYMFRESLQDNSKALLISLNCQTGHEAADCTAIINGSYDSLLREGFQYLNTLSCPVFVRIAGECNSWETRASAETYIAAFRHVADLLRSNAPRAATVFSPLYMSGNNEDMDMYYPGDAYVDWVGCSLYYNKGDGTSDNDRFYGVGEVFGDPMLNVQQTVNLSKLHNKPVILTEGGSAITFHGVDTTAFAAERLDKAISFLPMVYPQIKAMVLSNYHLFSSAPDFNFEQNSTVGAAHDRAAANNPTLLKSTSGTASYYTKASAYNGAWDGTMKLAAYTYASTRLTATWSVDGQDKATVSEYPYAFSLDTNALSPGRHTVKVTFSNGQTKSQEFTSRSYSAAPTPDKLYVNGVLQTPTVYKINDNNYFKLRDVAILLSGSEKQFALGYDASVGAVQVTTGQPYVPNGSELAGQASGSKNAVPTSDTIYIDGAKAEGLTVYQIDGNNYFKLRDLGRVLDFYVGWDESTGSITISGDAGYSD